jgi:hypothetical protein
MKFKVNPTNKCGLQDMIESTYNQYLDKTTTLAERSCGVDLYLDTYIPKHVVGVGAERTYQIQEEKKYRSILKEYAINDVFAVTKLSYDMKLIDLLSPSSTIAHEENNYEEQMNMQQKPSVELKPPNTKLKLHVQDELPELNEHEVNRNKYSTYGKQGETISIEIELAPLDTNMGIFDFEDISNDDQDGIYDNELQLYENQPLQNKKKVSLHDEEIELISDDETDNQKYQK